MHYFCLGAHAGIIPNAVGIFREIVFFNRNRKWASSPIWGAVFIVINFLLGIRTFAEWYDIIPIAASSFVTVALWLDNPNLTKLISAPVSASFLVYDIFVGSYIGIVNDFSVSGIKSALAANNLPCKKMYSDIGIMQKLTYRIENGEKYYYTGAYSGDFTCIIKSKDLVEWEYVSQPDFINDSKWENATYVLNDKVYYFVRQQDTNKSGFLTAYDLTSGTWETPVEIYDCQSRSDFILYRGQLYLFHAPIDREHIGIVKINTSNLADSVVVLQAKMHTSCFYPYIQYYKDNELAMSYTVSRQHIRLAEFTLGKYLD